MPVLSRAAAVVDGDRYERLTQTLDDTGPFFIETQKIFRELRAESQCLFLYTMARYGDGTHRFIFDGEEPGTENYTHIGTVEDVSNYDETYLLTYETGTPQFTPMIHQFSWGRLISAYMPIHNSAGNVVGVIGVDFEGEDIYQTIMRSLWLQIALAVLFIAAGLFLYYLFLKDLSRQNEILNRLNRAKVEFLQDMSHEMKAPLTVIATGIDFADMQVKDGESAEDTLKTIDVVRNETQRLGRMVDGMVKLAAMNDVGENRKRVDFAALLKNSAEVFVLPLERNNNTLRVDVAEDLPDVFVETDKLTQVITNIFTNAAKHTRDGRITLTADSDNEFITVRISDTGTVISPAALPRVFERGFSESGGTGYGLFLCKMIVEAHGGTIKAESAPGGGAVITFTVPVYGGQEAGHGV
jgi:signal transduction histidine kinase